MAFVETSTRHQQAVTVRRGDLRAPLLHDELEQLAGRIKRALPAANLKFSRGGLYAEPMGANGFPVFLELLGGTPTIFFSSCQHEFDDLQSAEKYFILAVSPFSRLRMELSGSRVVSWWLEAQSQNGPWFAKLAGGGVTPWFWNRKRVAILQNNPTAEAAPTTLRLPN